MQYEQKLVCSLHLKTNLVITLGACDANLTKPLNSRWTLFAGKAVWLFVPPFPLLLLMMESQACLYMKCPENICSEGFRP